jgi:hypothetical protein
VEVLNEDTWMKVAFDFELGWRVLHFILEEDQEVTFYFFAKNFFSRKYNRKPILPDQIDSFITSLQNHILKISPKTLQESERKAIKLEEILYHFQLILYKVIPEVFPYDDVEYDYKLIKFLEKPIQFCENALSDAESH